MLRGLAGHIILLYVFFLHIFIKKIRCSYTIISSIIVAYETRLTENGIPPEPNLKPVKRIGHTRYQRVCLNKSYIHSIFLKTI